MRPMRVVLAVVLLCTAAFAAESPFSGTWKLNVAKSKLPPPAPKSEIYHVVADNDNFHVKGDIIDDKGQSMTITYDAKFDGKDYLVTGDPTSDSISFKRVDANTIKGTGKKAAKVVATSTIVVSSDGKTTTVDFVDSSQGTPQSGTAVYDKQ